MSASTYTPPAVKLVHEVTVDMILRPTTQPIHLVQNDDRLPILAVTFTKNGLDYTIPEEDDEHEVGVNLKMLKPNAKMYWISCLGVSEDRNVAYFEMDRTATSISGGMKAHAEIVYGDQVGFSSPIEIVIDQSPTWDNAPLTPSEHDIIANVKAVVDEVAEYANVAKAESSAATASAQTAKVSESKAKISETNTKTSETNAKTSETNAAKSASTASTSANRASASATKAAASETSVAANASAASSYASAAKTSETNAKTSETNAAASASSAASSKTSAASSASSASTSASSASTSASNASKSEQNASASAKAAKTSETNAKTSETNAKTSETNAKTSETNAAKSESNALAYKNEAVAKAEAAQSYAASALEYANNAAAAQSASETARDSAKASENAAAESASNISESETICADHAKTATARANEATLSKQSAYEYAASAKKYAAEAKECASVSTEGLTDNMGLLADLETYDKTNLVAAINNVKENHDYVGLDARFVPMTDVPNFIAYTHTANAISTEIVDYGDFKCQAFTVTVDNPSGYGYLTNTDKYLSSYKESTYYTLDFEYRKTNADGTYNTEAYIYPLLKNGSWLNDPTVESGYTKYLQTLEKSVTSDGWIRIKKLFKTMDELTDERKCNNSLYVAPNFSAWVTGDKLEIRYWKLEEIVDYRKGETPYHKLNKDLSNKINEEAKTSIGGSNLLLAHWNANTALYPLGDNTNKTTVLEETWHGSAIFLTSTAWSDWSTKIPVSEMCIDINNVKYFTFSVYVKLSNDLPEESDYSGVYVIPAIVLRKSDGTKFSDAYTKQDGIALTDLSSTKYTRLVVTRRIDSLSDEDIASIYSVEALTQLTSNISGVSVLYTGHKLETGSHPTDYTLPETALSYYTNKLTARIDTLYKRADLYTTPGTQGTAKWVKLISLVMKTSTYSNFDKYCVFAVTGRRTKTRYIKLAITDNGYASARKIQFYVSNGFKLDSFTVTVTIDEETGTTTYDLWVNAGTWSSVYLSTLIPFDTNFTSKNYTSFVSLTFGSSESSADKPGDDTNRSVSYFDISDGVGVVSDLTTTSKTNLVSAINELVTRVAALEAAATSATSATSDTTEQKGE